MKLFHLSDLHLGKRLGQLPLLEDQAHILQEILALAQAHRPQAVLIAGDVYDKTVPPVEAVRLFDDFLWQLTRLAIQVYVISGNHDSPERIAFGGRIMDQGGVFLAPVYDGHVTPYALADQHGPVDLFLLPFVKPVHVRQCFPEAGIVTYTDALRQVVASLSVDSNRRNVLVGHQFVTGAQTCQSEDVSVGGLDNVDASVFDPFDYVALGHLHSPQRLHRETLRYCGSPLKYSFSETGQTKSVSLIELGPKGWVGVSTLPLMPLRDMRKVRGTYLELTDRHFYQGANTQDYLHITLTDEEDIPDAMGKLRSIYPYVTQLEYDNQRTRAQGGLSPVQRQATLTPLELFARFYQERNGQPLSPPQEALVAKSIAEIWEGRL